MRPRKRIAVSERLILTLLVLSADCCRVARLAMATPAVWDEIIESHPEPISSTFVLVPDSAD
jgi:hypothetical protein